MVTYILNTNKLSKKEIKIFDRLTQDKGIYDVREFDRIPETTWLTALDKTNIQLNTQKFEQLKEKLRMQVLVESAGAEIDSTASSIILCSGQDIIDGQSFTTKWGFEKVYLFDNQVELLENKLNHLLNKELGIIGTFTLEKLDEEGQFGEINVNVNYTANVAPNNIS